MRKIEGVGRKNGSKRGPSRDEEVREYDMLVRVASAVVLIGAGLLLALAALGAAGPVGTTTFGFAYTIVGLGAFLLPLGLIMIGLYAGFGWPSLAPLTATGGVLMLSGVLAFAGLVPGALFGGAAGTWFGALLEGFFGFWGALVLLVMVVVLGIVITTDIEALVAALIRAWDTLMTRRRARLLENDEPEDPTLLSSETDDSGGGAYPEESGVEAPREQALDEPIVTMFGQGERPHSASNVIANFDRAYDPPPLSILSEDRGRPGVGDIKANANIIKRTFQNFGIDLEMDEISIGPTVTRYAVKPAEGVRLSKIVSLANNLELALAAHPVRIEAPIPGKSLVGIEVPNAVKAMVGLGGILGCPEWHESTKPLLAALGRDISGSPHYVNIAKTPHVLVAGATGSGKSVGIHTLITSLLYRNGPNQLRFILIDPKRVELTLYNGIPHLLTPVITDPKRTILALKWAGKEMERRYDILETERVRDIDSYHASVYEPAKKKGYAGDMPEAMPFIVIVIDELADIMHSYPRELEASIVRLAQMSRAVGIHLVLSTQRPSVNVITGLIKANIPTRLAFQVASQIDSRTILDASGAETLLGAGDMLYLSGDMSKPVRLQTAFISETEVKKVAGYIKSHNAGTLAAIELGGAGGPPEASDAIMLAGGAFDDDDEIDDDLYEDARRTVEEIGRASTSYLQRKLKIGYSRAARLMDVLEARGVIGGADGSKPREVLSKQQHAPETSETDEADLFL